MGLLSLMDRLQKLNPAAFTVWATTQNGWRYQANVQVRRGGGWHVQFGMTMEEAMIEAIEGCLKGGPVHDDVPAVRARDAIRAAADPDDDPDPPRQRRQQRDEPRQERKRADLFDERPQGRQERQRR